MSDSQRELTAQELAKIEVETRKLESEILAQEAKAEIDLLKARAEARKMEVETEEAESNAASAKLDLSKKQRDELERKASNKYHHIYRFASGVEDKSVDACINQLDIWDRVDPGCEVTLIFTSPGGSVVHGMALWDYLVEFRANGHNLITHTQGMAASMAGILLQAGDVRVMGRESWLLIHQVQAGMMGSYGELQDRMKWLEMTQDRILDIFARRSAEVTGKTFESRRTYVKRNWMRTDWWISSDEALKQGLVDEVR